MQGKGEENDEHAQGQPQVQPRGCEEVKPAPPAKVTLLDPVLENEADGTPREVIEWCGWRNGTCPSEYERGHNISNRRLGPPLGGQVHGHRQKSADTKEYEKARVDPARREHPGGPNQTPNDRSSEENTTSRTSEVVSLLRGAHILDADQRKVEDNDLHETSNCRSNYLRHEHGPGGDLHVVTKLEVRDKTQGLRHGDVPKCLKTEGGYMQVSTGSDY